MRSNSSKYHFIGLCLALLLYSACGGDSAYVLKAQRWKNINVFIEIRPNPPKSGMNELLVVATRSDGKPASDMIVSVSSNAHPKPVQTIQDGLSGVYRRAVRLEQPASDSIVVTLQSREKGSEGEIDLKFPVSLTK